MATASTPTVRDLADKLIERLRPSGWADVLLPFLASVQFEEIITKLQREVAVGNRFTPPLKKVFRPFEDCPYSKLHTVFVGTEPYFTPEVADGLLLSTPNGGRKPAALVKFQREIAATVYKCEREFQNDLGYIASQGVLLLNAALTTKIGEQAGHYSIWRPFMNYLFFDVLSRNTDILFIYLGQAGHEYSDMLTGEHIQLFMEHPAQAPREGWESHDIFGRINRLLLEKGDIIVW